MSDGEENPDTDNSHLRLKIKFYADVVLKLTPVIATVVLGLLANQYQASSSAANLLNQREQAETQLRASLFENLIAPIGGAKGGEGLDADQQRLFVELLMLNFHEHIEFKPLLIHADKRLSKETEDKKELKKARDSLRSVARRVRDRQVTVLLKEQKFVYEISEDCSERDLNCDFLESDNAYLNEKVWRVQSPDEAYAIDIRIEEMDWENQTFDLTLDITEKDNMQARPSFAVSFTITPYDLPFTDNMVISRNQRFAIGVKNVDLVENWQSGLSPKAENRVTLQAVWFPKGYILPRERPVNFRELRNLLKLKDDIE